MPTTWNFPIKAANKLSVALNQASEILSVDRFPVNVDEIALTCAESYGWKDPILEVKPINIDGFEGCLHPKENGSGWLLAYNENIRSDGRVRFTKAHELGHYLMHRHSHDSFTCTRDDMLDWFDEKKNIEKDADTFASYLLMPLDDYRSQISSNKIDFDLLGHCADRYGVSLVSATLKWLEFSGEKAVLIMSNDGFIQWACSSPAAYKSGAFFKSRSSTVPIPTCSITANNNQNIERTGQKIKANIWFQHADPEMYLREFKIFSTHYDSTITLLILPKTAKVWPPWAD